MCACVRACVFGLRVFVSSAIGVDCKGASTMSQTTPTVFCPPGCPCSLSIPARLTRPPFLSCLALLFHGGVWLGQHTCTEPWGLALGLVTPVEDSTGALTVGAGATGATAPLYFVEFGGQRVQNVSRCDVGGYHCSHSSTDPVNHKSQITNHTKW